MATRIWDGDTDTGFATAANWAGGSAPVSTDSVVFPAGTPTYSPAGSDQTAILLVDFTVEPFCATTFGSRSAFLQIDTDYMDFAGSGVAFFDIDNSTKVKIANAAAASATGSHGVTLLGASNALLIVDPGTSGSVGICPENSQTAAFTTVQVDSGTVGIGDGLTATTLNVNGGTVESRSAPTTVNVNGGVYYQHEGTPTTLNIYGGTVYYNEPSMDSLTVNLYGGTLDFSKDGRAKTGTVTVNGYNGTIKGIARISGKNVTLNGTGGATTVKIS